MSAPENSSERQATDPTVQAVYEAVAAALAHHDKATAVRTAVEAVTSGAVAIPVLYRDVLSRILADTGAAWQTGKAAIWEEHLASATVRTIVEIVYPGVLKAKAEVPPSGRTRPAGVPARRGARPRPAHGGRPLRHGRLDHVLPRPGHPGRRRSPTPRGGSAWTPW